MYLWMSIVDHCTVCVYMSCISRLARELHIHSIFLHNFMKDAEPEREEEEEEFSDNSVEEAGSEEGRHTTPPSD